jgi:hypothetical protein
LPRNLKPQAARLFPGGFGIGEDRRLGSIQLRWVDFKNNGDGGHEWAGGWDSRF